MCRSLSCASSRLVGGGSSVIIFLSQPIAAPSLRTLVELAVAFLHAGREAPQTCPEPGSHPHAGAATDICGPFAHSSPRALWSCVVLRFLCHFRGCAGPHDMLAFLISPRPLTSDRLPRRSLSTTAARANVAVCVVTRMLCSFRSSHPSSFEVLPSYRSRIPWTWRRCCRYTYKPACVEARGLHWHSPR